MDDIARLTPEFLLRHEGFVLALARSLVRDGASAQDVAQDAWLAALEHRPRAESLRGWLARVVRNRASNLRRDEERRADRERISARSEAHEPAADAQEDLELQHRLVSAVLALDEPYRRAVIAVYFRGLAPSEAARELGLPAGTLRSQLSRALDLLRARLDREHDGSGRAWSAAFASWIRRSAALAPAPAASTAAPAWPIVAWSGALAAASAIVFAIWRQADTPRGDLAAAPQAAATTSNSKPLAPSAAESMQQSSPETPAARTAVATSATASSDALRELPAMLVRIRQIKQLLLDRALTPEPEVVAQFAWLTQLPNSGVDRIVDRTRFGFDVDLPWLDGGGAYFSFSRRSHDYQSEPQIELLQGVFASGFAGFDTGLVIDLGAIDFEALVRAPEALAATLDAKLRPAWDYLHGDVRIASGADAQAFREGLPALGFRGSAACELDHSYLVRSIQERRDVLAAFQVVRALDGQYATFAWHAFDVRALGDPRRNGVGRESATSLPAPPPELVALDDARLSTALDALRERGTQVLFALPPELEPLAASLANRDDAGLVRLLDTSDRWTEFSHARAGGAYYSFVKRSHSYDDEPDISCTVSTLHSGFYGASVGWYLELGDVPLDQVQSMGPPANEAAWSFLWTLDLPHADRARVSAALNEARAGANALHLESRVRASPKTTWLLRNVLPEEHDVLAAVRIAASDAYGHFIEWRVLKSWPVPPR